jgi:putative drug exporter of the RND superfamily
MTTDNRAAGLPHMPIFARSVHKFAPLIVLGWIGLVVVLSVFVPSLDKVGKAHTVSMSPNEAASMQAMKRVGKVFNEFDSDSAIMIVLEGDAPLGDDAHHFYDQLIQKLEADKKHVEHVQDFWGDPLTAAGSQSSDGKAAYVQVYLAGNQGESKANESVQAVRDIVASVPAPHGVKAYVTGAAALTADQSAAGEKGVILVTMITFLVIILMLLWVYRSIITVFITLLMVVIELFAARQVVAFLAHNNIIGLSTFAVNLLVLMAIAAGTDYAIFVLGRYQEARSLGEDRDQAFYTMFHGTAHGLRPDHRRRDVLPQLYPASLFPDARRALRGGNARCRLRRAHPRPGRVDGGESLRAVRPQAEDADAGMAAGRHRDRAVARPDSGGVDRHRADRVARPARVQDELRQSQVSTELHQGEYRI